MRIKKTSQYMEGGAHLSNVFGASTSNGYTQNYLNGITTCYMSEHRVGTWIDGKPIYSRWFKTTISSGQVVQVQAITRSDYGIIWVNNYFSENSGGSIIGAYYSAATDMQRVWFEGSNNHIVWQGGTSFPSLPITLWYELRYTKSTG